MNNFKHAAPGRQYRSLAQQLRVGKIFLGCLLSLLLITACSAQPKAKRPPVRRETPAEEILRIATTWSTSFEEKALLSAPSPLTFSNTRRESIITLDEKSATEELLVNEELGLRKGGKTQCRAGTKTALKLRWGRFKGAAAVELIRPAIQLKRSCSVPAPENRFVEERKKVLFVLREEQLVAVKPPLENRVYQPMY
ncbi:MAG: hypothetical protein MK135_07755 [Polyangiaceae bacterium]|nr:hypothetical protein [Polyangiaceae bacterium]